MLMEKQSRCRFLASAVSSILLNAAPILPYALSRKIMLISPEKCVACGVCFRTISYNTICVLDRIVSIDVFQLYAFGCDNKGLIIVKMARKHERFPKISMGKTSNSRYKSMNHKEVQSSRLL